MHPDLEVRRCGNATPARRPTFMATGSAGSRLLGLVILSVPLGLWPATGTAQEDVARRETEHLVSVSLRGGAMATDDQRQVLRLDREGARARIVGALRPLPWLSAELALGGLVVGGHEGVGAVLDASLGLRAMPRLDRVSPFVAVSVGVGITGSFVVPVLEGAAGFWFDVAGEWSLGPEIGLTHVIWEDGPSRTSDALFVSAGLSLAFRPQIGAPSAERTTTVVRTRTHTRTRVVRELSPPVAPAPPSDPVALMRLVDRALPPATTRSITSMVPPLLFEHDRTDLSSCGEASLYDLLRAIDEVPLDTRIVVEGHADGTGEDAHNRELSHRRAAAVRDVLITHGVAPDRIEIRAFGEGEPLVEELDGRALSLNRRVVVHLVRTASTLAASAIGPISAEVAP